MKKTKKILFIVAALFFAAVVGVIVFINNSSPLSSLNDYRGPVIDIEEGDPNQSAGEGGGSNSWSGDLGFNMDLDKDIVNDRHRQIALKYKSLFAKLQSEYQAELNNMLKSAKADLERAQKDESAASLAKLALHYLNRGRAMEKECDKRFYSQLKDMEKELRRENMPTGLVGAAEKEYKRMKAQRKEDLMSIAKGYIKG